ncbi:MAG: hypothetical protein GF334_13405 [Candidatus Altiarchaeales archaeon]|nr:hypothetical protein [Candidatus Altiarchaeales archaeon]
MERTVAESFDDVDERLIGVTTKELITELTRRSDSILVVRQYVGKEGLSTDSYANVRPGSSIQDAMGLAGAGSFACAAAFGCVTFPPNNGD